MKQNLISRCLISEIFKLLKKEKKKQRFNPDSFLLNLHQKTYGIRHH